MDLFLDLSVGILPYFLLVFKLIANLSTALILIKAYFKSVYNLIFYIYLLAVFN